MLPRARGLSLYPRLCATTTGRAVSRAPLRTFTTRGPPLAQLQLSSQLQKRLSSTSAPGSSPGAASKPGAGPAGKGGKPKPEGLKISHLFGGLVGLGMLVTIYGLLEWYYSLQIWPEPVRGPLKNAIKAKGRGDYERADAFFRIAINAARSIPPSALEPDPLMKLSGIYVTWSAMLEMHGQPIRAYAALRDAIAFFGPDPLSPHGKTTASETAWSGDVPRELTEEEHHRAIGLAQKLGQLAARMGEMSTQPPYPVFLEQEATPVAVPPPKTDTPVPFKRGGKEDPEVADEPEEPLVHVAPVPVGLGCNANSWDDAAEVYLSGALSAMLRIGLSSRSPDAKGPVVAGRDVSLPHDNATSPDGEEDTAGRVNRRGLGMTMEALADVYARQKRPDLAAQLLVQAVSTVIPPQAVNPSLEDRCQAAMLMTGISTHTLGPRTPQAVRISRSWSLKALQLANDAAKEGEWTGYPTDPAHALCMRAKTAAQYNLGMLEEAEMNPSAAAKHFSAALNTAREANYGEGKREAGEALRRVRSALDGPKAE